jgi:hypothetical protein
MRTQLPPVVMTYLTFTVQLSFSASDVSMATPLPSCSDEKQVLVVPFLWATGVKYYECSMMHRSERRVYKWSDKWRDDSVQNHWVSGLYPSFGILNTRKHSVSETGSVSVQR